MSVLQRFVWERTEWRRRGHETPICPSTAKRRKMMTAWWMCLENRQIFQRRPGRRDAKTMSLHTHCNSSTFIYILFSFTYVSTYVSTSWNVTLALSLIHLLLSHHITIVFRCVYYLIYQLQRPCKSHTSRFYSYNNKKGNYIIIPFSLTLFSSLFLTTPLSLSSSSSTYLSTINLQLPHTFSLQVKR